MKALERTKLILEVTLLALFLLLGIHLWKARGRDHVFGLLTNKP